MIHLRSFNFINSLILHIIYSISFLSIYIIKYINIREYVKFSFNLSIILIGLPTKKNYISILFDKIINCNVRGNYMNIGIVNPELIHPRGAEKQACKLSYFLDKMGHEVTFYTFEKANNYIFDPLLSNVEIISLNKNWITTIHWMIDDLRWIYMIKKLSQKIGKHDIINAHNHPAQWISKFTDIPVVWMCNEPYMYADYQDRKSFKSPHYKNDRHLSSNVKLLLSLDSKMEEIINKMYPNIPVEIIGSGVDLEREIKHVENDYFDSIFVGPIHPQKRPLDIVKAFALLKEKIPNIRLHFVGDIIETNLKKEMRKISSNNNIELIFHGSISDEKLYELYDIADIAIFVPELQPWGIFPLETILGGIPTIISNQCGITDILPEDFPIVETKNINELADKILEVKENYSEYANKTAAASKIISDEYSWESYSKRMINIFNHCLDINK
jgi:glycosyltransferase involved in cell wall biosynthesis